MRHLVEDVGIKKFAVFYQYDAFGFDGLGGTELALKKYGLRPVAKASYIRGTLDVEEAVDKVTASDAEAVIVIGTYAPCAKFIKLVKQRKPCLIFHNVSFANGEELVERLGANGERVVIT